MTDENAKQQSTRAAEPNQASAQQIVSAAAPQEPEDVLLQDQPDTGLVGLEIEAAEIQLERWLKEAPHVRIIALYEMYCFCNQFRPLSLL